MILTCVEPASDKIKLPNINWYFIEAAGSGNKIAFPHVDSCLGIICEDLSGRYFAAHINGFYNDDMDYSGAFAAMLTKMPDKMDKSIIFGDLISWGTRVDICKELMTKSIYDVRVMNNHLEKAVDVLFDVDTGKVKLMGYKKDRDFNLIPPCDVKEIAFF